MMLMPSTPVWVTSSRLDMGVKNIPALERRLFVSSGGWPPTYPSGEGLIFHNKIFAIGKRVAEAKAVQIQIIH